MHSGSLLRGGFLLGVGGSCGALPYVFLSCSGVVCCCSCLAASVCPFGVYGGGAYACVDDAFVLNGLPSLLGLHFPHMASCAVLLVILVGI